MTTVPLSFSELIDAVRVQSLDESANPVFTDSQIKLAIRQAILKSQRKFFTTETTTLSYTAGTDGPYTLAADVQRIFLVTRARTGTENNPNVISAVSFDETVTSYRHIRRLGSNQLYFTRDYPDSTFTIWYERDVQVPIDDRTLNGAHTSGTTTLTLVDASPQLYLAGLPFYGKIDNEVVKVTANTSNTSATMTRGALSSIAASHADGATISQLVWSDTPNFYFFLFSEIGRLLNMWRVQSGNQNVSVSANITAARFFGEDSKEAREQLQQPQRAHRMSFTKYRRPRRQYS